MSSNIPLLIKNRGREWGEAASRNTILGKLNNLIFYHNFFEMGTWGQFWRSNFFPSTHLYMNLIWHYDSSTMLCEFTLTWSSNLSNKTLSKFLDSNCSVTTKISSHTDDHEYTINSTLHCFSQIKKKSPNTPWRWGERDVDLNYSAVLIEYHIYTPKRRKGAQV